MQNGLWYCTNLIANRRWVRVASIKVVFFKITVWFSVLNIFLYIFLFLSYAKVGKILCVSEGGKSFRAILYDSLYDFRVNEFLHKSNGYKRLEKILEKVLMRLHNPDWTEIINRWILFVIVIVSCRVVVFIECIMKIEVISTRMCE